MNNTLCSAAWTDININFGERNIRHCCKSVEIPFPETLSVDFFNDSLRIKKTRSDLVAGIQTEDCISCWNDYKKTGTAYRDFKNKWKSTKDINTVVNNIEIILDNLCDMACVYCDEFGSSRIATEKNLNNRLFVAKNEDLDTFVEFLKILANKQNELNISFSGGEVTYSKQFFYFVEKLIADKKLKEIPISFSFLTNGNTLEKNMQKINLLLNQMPENWYITVGMSCETIGKSAELIRYGLSWDRFLYNFKAYYNHSKVNTMVLSPTLNIFSVKEFPLFVKTISNIATEINNNKKINIIGNWVTKPDILNPCYSSAKYKTEIINLKNFIIDSHIINNKNNFVNFLDKLSQKIGSFELDSRELDDWLSNLAKQKKDNRVLDLKKLL
jgi:hypothetical protein